MIERIRIEGFKSMKEMELELKPINILIGSNGSGKSNFISFFKLVSAIFNNGLQRHVIVEGADNLLYFGSKTTKMIKGKLTFTNDGNNGNIYDFGLSQKKQGGLFIDYETLNIGTGELGEYRLSQYLKEESELAKGEIPINRTLIKNISSLKIFHFDDTSSTSNLRKGCDTSDNIYLKPDGRNLPAILYLIKENHPKIFDRIEKTIQSVAPYIANFLLEPQETEKRGNRIELKWVDKGDLESSFTAYHLSDGTLRFIALAVLLMQPKLPETIILDEPELGLHPQAIGRLASLIKAASGVSQIIISTQSADLISDFAPEDVIAVDQKDSCSVFQRLNTADLDIWLQDYSLGELWQRNILNKAQPFNN